MKKLITIILMLGSLSILAQVSVTANNTTTEIKLNNSLESKLPCTIDFSNATNDNVIGLVSGQESRTLSSEDLKKIKNTSAGGKLNLQTGENKILEEVIVLGNTVKISVGNLPLPKNENSKPISDTLKASILSGSERSTIVDAIDLAGIKTVNVSDTTAFLNFFNQYKDKIKVNKSKNGFELVKDSGSNKYLKDFIDTLRINTIVVKRNDSEKDFGGGDSQGGLPSSLSPTGIADLLGTFIANRFKQEINVAFLNKFKEDLENSTKYQGLITLLPKSYQILHQNDPYQYTVFFQGLREAFHDDFEHLPKNGVEFLTLQIKGNQTMQKRNIIISSALALDVVADILDKRPFSETITGLADRGYIKKLGDTVATKNILASIETLSRLSYHLEIKTHDNWVDDKTIKKLLDDKVLKLFLGLMITKDSTILDNIKFTNEKSLTQLLQDDKVYKLKNVISDLSIKIKSFATQVKTINDLESQNNSNPNFRTAFVAKVNLAQRGISIVESAYNLGNVLVPNIIKDSDKKLLSITTEINNVLDFTNFVAEKKYGLALSSLANLYFSVASASTTIEEKNRILAKDKKSLESLKMNLASLNKENLDDDKIAKDSEKVKNDIEKLDFKIGKLQENLSKSIQKEKLNEDNPEEIKTAMLKYGNFAVSVINAKTTDDAVQALEAAALPVGSYRIKRNNFFNISLNAYGGVFAGSETFNKVNQFVWGATAPVGIYVGLGKSQSKVKKNDGSGVGLFVSLLDVGSVFALRLQGDTNPLPELSWRNIIAPGLNIVYNIPKLPVSIMIGGQKGPELRSFEKVINTTTQQEEPKAKIDPYAWRFHISAVVDIPVFNIYTKANKN